MTVLKLRRERDGSPLILGDALHKGGEGSIYAVRGENTLVAKMYHHPSAERAAKLRAMLASPPEDAARTVDHVSFAWPVERVLDEHGTCCGYLMPYVAPTRSATLATVYNPKERRKLAPGMTWRFLLQTARNLASVVAALHARGYVIGDLNASNVLVSNTALVTLVDCDSMQAPDEAGAEFLCTVGTPEYTPAELHGKDLSQTRREAYHDAFGLAVLIFQLLMEGVHPFAGRWVGPGEQSTLEGRILTGDWPYAFSTYATGRVTPGPHALPLDVLPPAIQELMQDCFVTGHFAPDKRPSAEQWCEALQEAGQSLAICAANQQHHYSKHLERCPWCDRMANGLPDPFPPVSRSAGITPPPNATVCVRCGAAQRDGAKFCSRCGGHVHSTERAQSGERTKSGKRATPGPRVFAVANQKGSVGKTITTINLAACLADAGSRTLVVDMSPGAEATTSLGVDPHRVGLSVSELLACDDDAFTDALKADLRPNLALIPSKGDLWVAEIALPNLDQHEFRLKRILDSVRDDYDFVLIDCPSLLGSLTLNALTAADGVILPLRCDSSALEGVQPLLNTIRLVRDRLNPHVGLFGVVVTMYDPRTQLAAEEVDEITQHFPKEKFKTLIPRNTRLAETLSFGLTILEHDARSPGALAYKSLAEEVIARAATTAERK